MPPQGSCSIPQVLYLFLGHGGKGKEFDENCTSQQFYLSLAAMTTRDKIYFASDFHLGAHPRSTTRERESRIVRWLDFIKVDAAELYLMGDIFDFWFEYATVVPKGYIRFLGKLAELADLGVKISLFKGNHDMWMFGYLKNELGAEILDNELILERGGKTFYLHHGDGLGPGDGTYKLLKKIFRSRFCQWLFARLHPNLGIGIAQRWSAHSRIASGGQEKFQGEDKEWLVIYAKSILEKQRYDYFIFGHRHLPLEVNLPQGSKYINLGEWINYNTYAVFDGIQLTLRQWES